MALRSDTTHSHTGPLPERRGFPGKLSLHIPQGQNSSGIHSPDGYDNVPSFPVINADTLGDVTTTNAHNNKIRNYLH